MVLRSKVHVPTPALATVLHSAESCETPRSPTTATVSIFKKGAFASCTVEVQVLYCTATGSSQESRYRVKAEELESSPFSIIYDLSVVTEIRL